MLIQESSKPSPDTETIPGHLDYLDGIRAIAALFVLLHHAWIVNLALSARPGIGGLLTNWMLYGRLTVDVFIVLSGFCLTLPVVRKGELSAGIMGFYARRAQRILPPYYAAIVVSVLINILTAKVLSSQYHLTLAGFAVHATMLEHLDPSVLGQIDPPMWSVAVEWWIYFLFPAFVWLLFRFGLSAVAPFVLLGAIFTFLETLFLPASTLFRASPWYVGLFGFGVVSAFIASNHKATAGILFVRQYSALLFVTAVIAGAITIHRWPINISGDRNYERHDWIIDSIVGAAVGLAFVWLYINRNAGSLLVRTLSNKYLVKIGIYAYSIYLLHWPLICLEHGLLENRFHLSGSKSFVFTIGSVPIMLALIYAFHLVFERPFMRAKRFDLKPLEKEKAMADEQTVRPDLPLVTLD